MDICHLFVLLLMTLEICSAVRPSILLSFNKVGDGIFLIKLLPLFLPLCSWPPSNAQEIECFSVISLFTILLSMYFPHPIHYMCALPSIESTILNQRQITFRLMKWFSPCVTTAVVVVPEWGRGAALWRSSMSGCALVLHC